MITGSNADVLAKQLEEYKLVMKRKLENMVVRFATDIAASSSDNTPIGDNASIASDGAYRDYYLQRQLTYNLAVEAGFHKGNWQYSESNNFSFRPIIYSYEEMKSNVYGEADMSYSLGDTFYIGASGPAYIQLEQGLSSQAPNGIKSPTLSQIETAYRTDLQRYYREG